MIDKTRKMYIGWQHLKCIYMSDGGKCIAYVKKEQYSLYFHLRKELVCMEENGGLSDGKFSTVSREKGIQRGD